MNKLIATPQHKQPTDEEWLRFFDYANRISASALLGYSVMGEGG